VNSKHTIIYVTLPIELQRALSEACRVDARNKSAIVQEALQLYFGAREGKASALSLSIPSAEGAREHTDLAAFAPEWNSPLDSAYDILSH
jgi:hypothetical protein